jgi:tripartite-type tricarboxylate transporter receptor subunit TctC
MVPGRCPIARRAALAVAASLTVPRLARTQTNFPSRPITIVAPSPPGGTSDLNLRVLAEGMSRRLTQPVVVENRPGGGQAIAPMTVMRARPDGHVIGQLNTAAVRHALLTDLPMRVPEDFTPLVMLGAFNVGVVVRADRFPGGWVDFVAEARRRPGELSFGSTGTNAAPHIGMVQLAQREGIVLNHIPYRGDPDGLTALLGGHIDAMAGSTGVGAGVDSGQARWLHVWSAQRLARWPDAPTLKELGYPDIILGLTLGIVGPAGLDPAVAGKLEEVLLNSAREPQFRAALARYDMAYDLQGSMAYAAHLRDVVVAERQLIERLHLRAS